MIPADTIARALKGRRCGAGWVCKCPAHDDHHPSLSVAETRDRKTLVKCWSGCRQDDVIDALRRRGLWDGKARETSQAGKPRALVAERETTLKPRDPMKTWRNAGPWVRGSAADTYLETRGIELSEDEASSLRFAPASVALADAIALAGHAGACRARLRRRDNHAPDVCSARRLGQGAAGQAGAPFRRRRTHDRRRRVVRSRGSGSRVHRRRRDRDPRSRAMRIFGVSAGCAALSAFGIRTLVLPSQARRVRISADHDEHGQGLAAAREAGRRWLAEGRAVAVSMAAKVGEDANDVWRKRLRSHG